MLFLTRACLCIGTIMVLAEGADLKRLMPGDAAGTLAESAARPLQAFCRERPAACVAAIGAAVQAGTGTTAATSSAMPHTPKREQPQRPSDRRTGTDRRV